MTSDTSENSQEVRLGPFALASVPRIGRAHNEDVARVMDTSCAWVLDGADDPLADDFACRHDARWYVDELSNALSQYLSESRNPLNEVLAQSIREVANRHRLVCANPSPRQPCATVAMVRLSSKFIDYLVLGDASLLIRKSESTSHVSDKRLQEVAPQIRQEIWGRLRDGHGYADPARGDLLRNLAEAEREARNSDEGYWITSYSPEAAFHALVKSIPVTDESAVTEMALMTDGLERALSTFEIFTDCGEMLRALLEHGPIQCIDRVRDAEMKDRWGRTYPRTKFSDDASVVVWANKSDS